MHLRERLDIYTLANVVDNEYGAVSLLVSQDSLFLRRRVMLAGDGKIDSNIYRLLTRE
jgi:hypothetical protein